MGRIFWDAGRPTRVVQGEGERRGREWGTCLLGTSALRGGANSFNGERVTFPIPTSSFYNCAKYAV